MSIPTPEQFPLLTPPQHSEEAVQRILGTVRRTLAVARSYPVTVYSGRGQPGDGPAWKEVARRLREVGWTVSEDGDGLRLSPTVIGG